VYITLSITGVFYENLEAFRPETNLKTFRSEASINLSAIIYNLFYNVGATTVIRSLFIIKISYKDLEASRSETSINLNEIIYNLFYNVGITIIARSLFKNL
jgi:hypothetical protein